MFAVEQVTSGADAVTTITLSAGVVTAVVGTLIPILVGVITKLAAPEWIKAYLHLLLSVVSGAVISATQLDGTAVLSRQTLLIAVATWLVGIATYHGFWKPTSISPVINTTTRNVGIGDGPVVEKKAETDTRVMNRLVYTQSKKYPSGPVAG